MRGKGEDAPNLEKLLTRTSGDLRRGVLGLLLRLSDADALTSADRLTGSKNAQQRLAGLELLRQLHEAKRCLAEAANGPRRIARHTPP